MEALGEIQVRIDCDVIQADGGTRTAAITGGYVALHLAFIHLVELGLLAEVPLIGQVAAVSAGLWQEVAVLDLDYEEDSHAQADANFVLTDTGAIVEVQATAEDKPFSEDQLAAMLGLAKKGIGELVELQKAAIAGAGD